MYNGDSYPGALEISSRPFGDFIIRSGRLIRSIDAKSCAQRLRCHRKIGQVVRKYKRLEALRWRLGAMDSFVRRQD
jgi:hypothetical protein